MTERSLGLIETIGLTAAIEAADAAVKSANVELVGYELTKGEGMTVVKLLGEVGAIKAAVSAGAAAAGRVNRVVSTKVIARPARDLAQLVVSPETVGVAAQPHPADTPDEAPAKAPVAAKDAESGESQAEGEPQAKPAVDAPAAEPPVTDAEAAPKQDANEGATAADASSPAAPEAARSEDAPTQNTVEAEEPVKPDPQPPRSGARNRRRSGSSRKNKTT